MLIICKQYQCDLFATGRFRSRSTHTATVPVPSFATVSFVNLKPQLLPASFANRRRNESCHSQSFIEEIETYSQYLNGVLGVGYAFSFGDLLFLPLLFSVYGLHVLINTT
jgi:hypothetical protein